MCVWNAITWVKEVSMETETEVNDVVSRWSCTGPCSNTHIQDTDLICLRRRLLKYRTDAPLECLTMMLHSVHFGQFQFGNGIFAARLSKPSKMEFMNEQLHLAAFDARNCFMPNIREQFGIFFVGKGKQTEGTWLQCEMKIGNVVHWMLPSGKKRCVDGAQ